MVVSFDKIGKKVTDNYYILVMFISFAVMLGVNLHIGVFITGLSLFYGLRVSLVKTYFIKIKLLIAFFIIYNLFTGIMYSFNNIPISIFFSEAQMQIVPIFFFFIGNDCRHTDFNFYKSTLIGSLFMFLTGLYLYFTMPEWYVNWKMAGLSHWLTQVDISYITTRSGLSSFFYTPYFTGYLSIVALAMILKLINKNGFKTLYIIFLFITLLVLVLAQIRVAWIVGMLILLISTIYGFFKGKRVSYYLSFSLIISLVFIIYFISIHEEYSNLTELILNRFDSINNAVAERSQGWIMEANNNFYILIGHGLGSSSRLASVFGNVISDGNYFKFFYEIGAIGVLTSFLIMISTLHRGLRYFNYFSIELAIVFFFTIAGIGANPFSMPIIIAIYWFSVGRIWNRSYLMFLKNTNHESFRIVIKNKAKHIVRHS